MKILSCFCLFSFLSFFCLSVCVRFSCAENQKYKSFSLFRATPSSELDLQVLLSIPENTSGFDFWKAPSVVNEPVDFVMPSAESHVIRHLTNSGLTVKELSSDLQRLVDDLDTTYLSETHKRNISSLDLNVYHTHEVISMWLHHQSERCSSSFCDLIRIGYSYENRPLDLIQIGNTESPIIFLECGIHAREWISPAVCINVIKWLIDGYGKDQEVVELLSNYNVYILPVTNPDGYHFTHTKDRLWRKTRRPNVDVSSECYGTDPNRNWGVGWGGRGSSSDPCSQIYRGPAAFSESETKAVRDFVLGLAPNVLVYLSIHSYGQHVLIPWSYKDSYPPDYQAMLKVGSALSFGIWKTSGQMYSVGQSYGIMGATSGSSDDWAKGGGKIKFSYTLEVRDEGKYGFLLPATQIHECALEVFEGIKYMAKYITENY